MKSLRNSIALFTLALTLSSGLAFAIDDHDHGHYVRHDEWHKGARIGHDDWNRGAKIDYRHYHLSAPPHGYEWREVDGNYVLAAAATGLISSVVIASTIH